MTVGMSHDERRAKALESLQEIWGVFERTSAAPRLKELFFGEGTISYPRNETERICVESWNNKIGECEKLYGRDDTNAALEELKKEKMGN